MAQTDKFQYSQASLQDFVDCRRRFQLRYLQRRPWPAVESEPVLENERTMRQGAEFHHMIQQHLLGIPAGRLSARLAAGDPQVEDLQHWWGHYLEHSPVEAESPARRYVEVGLAAALGEHTLVAKCDLVAVGPGGNVVIFDWKTARRKPRRTWLAARLQTRVYPYLLVRAGAHLNGGQPFSPEQVEMRYWFSDFPQAAERFPYSQEQYQADEAYLLGLVAEVARLDPAQIFPLTQDVRHCRFCVYRSLCDRGVGAGRWEEQDDALEVEESESVDFELDFDQIAEIEF
jgi:CRISPR/Cas system-associated exonuclease Cas4 (RecB family)